MERALLTLFVLEFGRITQYDQMIEASHNYEDPVRRAGLRRRSCARRRPRDDVRFLGRGATIDTAAAQARASAAPPQP